MRKFFELLQQKGSIALIGLLIGLVGGFKIANARYRSEQLRATNAEAMRIAANPEAAAGAGNSQQAQQETTAILERARTNANDIEAQLAAADQFLQIQRPQGALEFLNQANKLKPEDPRPMSALATAYLMMGKHEDAIKWARSGLQRRPDDLGAKVLLMFAYIESRQNLAEAEKLLSQVEAQRPGDKILVDAREALNEAKSGKPAPVANAPAASGDNSKTMLEHGATSAPPQK